MIQTGFAFTQSRIGIRRLTNPVHTMRATARTRIAISGTVSPRLKRVPSRSCDGRKSANMLTKSRNTAENG